MSEEIRKEYKLTLRRMTPEGRTEESVWRLLPVLTGGGEEAAAEVLMALEAQANSGMARSLVSRTDAGGPVRVWIEEARS